MGVGFKGFKKGMPGFQTGLPFSICCKGLNGCYNIKRLQEFGFATQAV